MAAFPIPLNSGETILRSDEQAAHPHNSLLGYNVAFGTLWLTDQRIMFQPSMLGSAVAYPLRHIARVTRSDTPIYYRATSGQFGHTTTYNASLYLEFDNGGKEYFIPKDIDAWVAAIMAAKTAAPDLPYSQVPPSRSAVGTNRGTWVILGIMAGIILLFLCTAMACVGLPLILSLLGGKGG